MLTTRPRSSVRRQQLRQRRRQRRAHHQQTSRPGSRIAALSSGVRDSENAAIASPNSASEHQQQACRCGDACRCHATTSAPVTAPAPRTGHQPRVEADVLVEHVLGDDRQERQQREAEEGDDESKHHDDDQVARVAHVAQAALHLLDDAFGRGRRHVHVAQGEDRGDHEQERDAVQAEAGHHAEARPAPRRRRPGR